jgi:hypothetical protein
MIRINAPPTRAIVINGNPNIEPSKRCSMLTYNIIELLWGSIGVKKINQFFSNIPHASA